MQGIEDEMELYEAKRQTDRNRFLGLSLIILLLLLLSAALTYIVLARRRHMSQLKSAYNHALESDKMKTAFIQNVSHEVRTPLNIISGFAQVIADPELAPSTKDRQEIAKMMRKNTKLITSLVDEMLMLSLNEAEGNARKDDKVEVNDLLRDLLQENQSIVQYGVALHFETQVDDDFAFMTNENMLKNIVNALIDNAAKNTEKGSITLKADANEEVFTLTVEDTGCGIPPNEAERVFERFVKLNTFKEGIGLGLSLCRTLAERLSGSIRLDTTYTQGARFVVTIPIPVVQD
jgi:signal transduction histidine kinase